MSDQNQKIDNLERENRKLKREIAKLMKSVKISESPINCSIFFYI